MLNELIQSASTKIEKLEELYNVGININTEIDKRQKELAEYFTSMLEGKTVTIKRGEFYHSIPVTMQVKSVSCGTHSYPTLCSFIHISGYPLLKSKKPSKLCRYYSIQLEMFNDTNVIIEQ